MTPADFKLSLAGDVPPAGLGPIPTALWHDAKGDWAAAHAVAQGGEGTPAFDRLHAYLHRKEGDVGNARYWYRRAGTAVYAGTLDAEWADLVAAHLA